MKFVTKIVVSLVLSTIVIFIFTGISCTLTPQGIQILSGDYTSPKFVSFKLTSENDATVDFSCPIDFEKIGLFSVEAETQIAVSSTKINDGSYQLKFDQNLDCTNLYSLEGNVKDSHGNTLYFKNTFQGYNSRVPEVQLNEIRTEYTKPKCEFVELLILSDGNLGGMELITASDGEDKVYILPPAEVKSGEYVVIHLRKLEDESEDELDEDITLSSGTESGSWRDLWAENTSARIAKSDVVLLKDRINGKIVDAVLFAESSYSAWKNDFIESCAKQAYEDGAWKNGYSVQNAVCSDGLTTSRTLSRISSGKTKDDWIVVASKGCSMGGENSTVAYVTQ